MARKTGSVGPEQAETLAIAALGFLAGDETRLVRFLSLTGMDPTALRRAAGQPDFHRSILDYIAEDESLLLAFCADQAHDPTLVLKAREALGHRPWERDFA